MLQASYPEALLPNANGICVLAKGFTWVKGGTSGAFSLHERDVFCMNRGKKVKVRFLRMQVSTFLGRTRYSTEVETLSNCSRASVSPTVVYLDFQVLK